MSLHGVRWICGFGVALVAYSMGFQERVHDHALGFINVGFSGERTKRTASIARIGRVS
jgi:hypothetical protein